MLVLYWWRLWICCPLSRAIQYTISTYFKHVFHIDLWVYIYIYRGSLNCKRYMNWSLCGSTLKFYTISSSDLFILFLLFPFILQHFIFTLTFKQFFFLSKWVSSLFNDGQIDLWINLRRNTQFWRFPFFSTHIAA